MQKTNVDLVKFAINKLGTPYIMGTNGKILTYTYAQMLIISNPKGWFTKERCKRVRELVGRATTDCHGLIEWFIGGNYDTSADNAFNMSKQKGPIKAIPEIPGVCVRYKGHVGIYIGNGLVVEARGFNYGVVITKLSDRPWTHWYKHYKIDYVSDRMDMPTQPIIKTSDKYDVVWLQMSINKQIKANKIVCPALVVDGQYGSKTSNAIKLWQQHKNWTVGSGFYVGANTINSLCK